MSLDLVSMVRKTAIALHETLKIPETEDFFTLRGSVVSYGQYSAEPEGYFYAFLQIEDESGQTINVTRTFALNIVNSMLTLNNPGEFYFERLPRSHKRLFGIKYEDGTVVYDETNARMMIRPVFGLLSGKHEEKRRKIFYGDESRDGNASGRRVPIEM